MPLDFVGTVGTYTATYVPVSMTSCTGPKYVPSGMLPPTRPLSLKCGNGGRRYWRHRIYRWYLVMHQSPRWGDGFGAPSDAMPSRAANTLPGLEHTESTHMFHLHLQRGIPLRNEVCPKTEISKSKTHTDARVRRLRTRRMRC